ncbi:uncharacterized protein LOC143572093 [Bidens hawaiensis]|uniref:uncharacterized protein LOC143572093 n=1 Tax=Bidens hawaiensis TaxID=980011 RepID=UPI00404B1414
MFMQAHQAPTPQASTSQTQAPQGTQGRAFTINAHQARKSNDVVNGTFLVNKHHASVLFDSGADKSFISFDFEYILDVRSKLSKPFTVEIANGSSIVIDSVVRNCTLTLNWQKFSIDLIPMQMGSFDVIIGMDSLSLHRAEILCFEKIIRIPIRGGVILNVAGERPFSKLNLMSCLQAQRYLRKKYVSFFAHVTTKAHEEKQLFDIPIVRDFPEVFPEDVSGLPPIRQVEFRIDLLPGSKPRSQSTLPSCTLRDARTLHPNPRTHGQGFHSPEFVSMGHTCFVCQE